MKLFLLLMISGSFLSSMKLFGFYPKQGFGHLIKNARNVLQRKK